MNSLGLVEVHAAPPGDGPDDECSRLLATAFLRATTTPNVNVVAVSERMIMATSRAATLIGGMEQGALWRWARARHSGGPALLQMEARTPIAATCRPVLVAQTLVGMLLELDVPTPRAVSSANDRAHLFSAALPGSSLQASELRAELGKASESDADVLITGERGSGKTTVARRLLGIDAGGAETVEFDAGEARTGEFALRLSAALRSNHVLLTHVDRLSGIVRSEVMGVLSQARSGSRVVATSSGTDLGEVLEGLFARKIALPALRDRLEDLPAIAAQLLSTHTGGRVKRLDPAVRRQLWGYHWPANVAELAEVLRSAAALAPTAVIDEACVRLPAGVGGGLGARRRSLMEAAEVDSLLDALRRCGGNKLAAADMLNISRSTLYRKVRAFGL